MKKAIRYNDQKLRFDLISPIALEELARVMTVGNEKYPDRNWERGLEWTQVVASLMRHLNKFMQGIDYDEESGCLHMAHVMANCMMILEYYKTHPELDDRPLKKSE